MNAIELLRAKYPPEAYALFFEVRDATGFAGKRTADAIAMSLWPSRGLELIGFEIKASRSDWKRELEDHAKAEPVGRYMDRWFIVATKKGIVEPAELPKTWGLLVANDASDSMRVVKEAPVLDATPLDRKFIAAMFRAAQKQVAEVEAEARRPLEAERQAIRSELMDEYRARLEKATQEAADRERQSSKALRDAVEEFERISGLNLFSSGGSRWNLGPIASAVKLLTAQAHAPSQFLRDVRELAEAAETARAAVEEMRAISTRLGADAA
jgi:hypothetical protein